MSPERYTEITALADRMVASCDGGSVEDHDTIGEMTQDECEALDAMAFKCEDCDQWFDIGDMHHDEDRWACIDCGEAR